MAWGLFQCLSFAVSRNEPEEAGYAAPDFCQPSWLRQDFPLRSHLTAGSCGLRTWKGNFATRFFSAARLKCGASIYDSPCRRHSRTQAPAPAPATLLTARPRHWQALKVEGPVWVTVPSLSSSTEPHPTRRVALTLTSRLVCVSSRTYLNEGLAEVPPVRVNW